jgi:SAM-dependent methyltransferase
VSRRLEQLDEAYRRHHEEHRSPGFVAGGPQRAPVFREWVGSGKRVLDLGCRYGALTRAYLDGNDVVGVDVDRRALAKAAKLGIETSSPASCSSTCRCRRGPSPRSAVSSVPAEC